MTSNCEVILTEFLFHFVIQRIHMKSSQLSGIETVGVIVEELFNTYILAIVEDKINCCNQVASFNFSFLNGSLRVIFHYLGYGHIFTFFVI